MQAILKLVQGGCAIAALASVAVTSVGCKRAAECAPCKQDSDCSGSLVCAPIVTVGEPEGRVCKPREQKNQPNSVLLAPMCPADCNNDCRVLGKCTLRGDECFIEKDADCKNASVCKDRGLCTFVDAPKGGYCTAKNDADCAGSKVCREQGLCKAYAPGSGLRGCGPSAAGATDAAAPQR